ncbi:hypothetical protein KIPB_008669 [Kipferlia bialata]|uniref:Uncharacterized protein n=1 Tax=Kipferlia bialata TaxID=797122 RepID=A0A9K3GKX1_9EUKA|nr:hypothetical protein KIPB_008669 [Kipferlia bialata]|eukprot:g8669.t1
MNISTILQFAHPDGTRYSQSLYKLRLLGQYGPLYPTAKHEKDLAREERRAARRKEREALGDTLTSTSFSGTGTLGATGSVTKPHKPRKSRTFDEKWELRAGMCGSHVLQPIEISIMLRDFDREFRSLVATGRTVLAPIEENLRTSVPPPPHDIHPSRDSIYRVVTRAIRAHAAECQLPDPYLQAKERIRAEMSGTQSRTVALPPQTLHVVEEGEEGAEGADTDGQVDTHDAEATQEGEGDGEGEDVAQEMQPDTAMEGESGVGEAEREQEQPEPPRRLSQREREAERERAKLQSRLASDQVDYVVSQDMLQSAVQAMWDRAVQRTKRKVSQQILQR